jgi:hypothetical protein
MFDQSIVCDARSELLPSVLFAFARADRRVDKRCG